MKRISIIVPTKNEPLIDEVIQKLHKVLAKVNHEIIVVDKSDVPPKITNARLVIQKSEGIGKAVLEGLNYAEGDIIVTMDGDGSHQAVEVLKLLGKANSYDVVIGSRFVSGGATEDSLHRKIVSFVFRKLASFILNLGIEDSMSGFAAVKKEVYDKLQLDPLGCKINMEIMFKGRAQGYKIYEVPIVFKKRKAGKSKAEVKEAFRVLRHIFELKLGLR